MSREELCLVLEKLVAIDPLNFDCDSSIEVRERVLKGIFKETIRNLPPLYVASVIHSLSKLPKDEVKKEYLQ